MRKILGVTGFAIFCFAIFFGWWLLSSKQISGAEFVVFSVAFTIIGGVVSFAPEVQEFSIAGNLVKLREVKNEVVRSVETLKKTQAELLRLLLRTKLFINPSFFSYDRSIMAIDKDFWDIVNEAKAIGALVEIKPQVLITINGILPVLYSISATYVVGCSGSFEGNEEFLDVVAALVGEDKVYMAPDFVVDGDNCFKYFVKDRVSEIENLYALKKELAKL